MTPLIFQLAGGVWIAPAAGVLAVAVLLTAAVRPRGLRVAALVLGMIAAATIVASAPAMPWPFDAAWAATVAAAAVVGRGRWPTVVRAAAVACTVGGGLLQLAYERPPPVVPGRATVLCAIGDSVTAGLGRRGEVTWPARLRADHGIRVVDQSRPGCTVARAADLAAAAGAPAGSVVVIEIGGNDLIGRTDPRRFAADLDRLVRAVDGADRRVVMFELPRLPFDDAYGLAQRHVAAAHGVTLVPRRKLAALLADPAATIDGVHLSDAGQCRLADLVWQVVGPAMGE